MAESLSHYRILDRIGQGGMGVVHRALDTRLGRHVAIKLLPDDVARDPERRARFEREARLLAALNHPSIGAIYGYEEAGHTQFLVLELVEGEGLDETLARGPLPVPEALAAAREVAEALAAAHARGIIHRDLKPANIRRTAEGRVKVLDFGLAKALAAARGAHPPGGADPARAPDATIAAPARGALATAEGIAVGTPAYMSPEQARGEPVDARTDLWSFGCLLFRLLSGREPFEGRSAVDTLAAVLEREPDLAALPTAVPDPVRRLVASCLEKDPARRPDGAAEAAGALSEALAGFGPSAPPRELPRLTQLTFAEEIEEAPAWSPDGSEIAFCREVRGVRKLFRKRLDTEAEQPLTSGEHDDIQPCWSSDGRTVLFVRARKEGRRLEPGDVFGEYNDCDIWTLDLATGREARLLERAYHPACSSDGARIAFNARWAGPLRIWTADANGRNPLQASTDSSEAVVHLRPRWSPDGRMIVFQNVERTKFDVRVLDLATRRLHWITQDPLMDIQPVWSPSGRFIYFSSYYRGGAVNVWRVPVDRDGRPAGHPQQVTAGAGQDLEPSLSPDASRLAYTVLRQNADLWRLPVDPGTGLPTGEPEKVVVSQREESRGSWSPDQRRIAFNGDRSGDMNLWLHSLETGALRQLTRGPGGDFQPKWSPDGRTLVFFSARDGTVDIWTADVETGALQRLTEGECIDVNPFFSPDGRRIAFQSDRDGRLEVWVMAADGSGARQLTRVGVGGHFLRWTQDGSGIYFSGGSPRAVRRVPVGGGEPEDLPPVRGGAHLSLSPDHSRIMDVVEHKVLWVSPLRGGEPERVYAFSDPDVRIDYPEWSPDGKWVLFDRFRPQGGDLWVLERVE
jgi:Tol biopolymer transport system component/serine/threonine protein kinase